MAQATTFPTFVSVDYDKSTGFRDFRADAVDAGNFVKRQFERDMADVQSTVRKALTLPAGASGAFKFDTASMRSAAAEAERNAQALRLVAKAAEEVARETDDNTAATRRNIQATQAAARQAEEEARALNAKAATYERLQDQINRTGAQITGYANSNRRLADSQRQVNQASIGAGQQLQDIAISLYSGQKAGVVFAQQLPQLSFALSALEGSTNKTLNRIGMFATFLSGPWGVAVGIAAVAAGTLIAKLYEGEKAMEAMQVASDNTGAAQSALGQMFDLATGKIINNTQAIRDNIYAQQIAMQQKAIIARQEGETALAESGAGRTSAGDRFFARLQAYGTRDPNIIRFAEERIAAQEAGGRRFESLGRGVAQGGISREQAGKILEAQRKKLGDTSYFALQNYLNRSAEEFSANKAARDIEAALGGKLPSDLLKPGKATKPKKTGGGGDEVRQARAIEDAVDRAADAVANLRGQFDEAPSDIDKAAKATRALDEELKKLDRRAADGKLTDAEKAKDAATRKQIEELKSQVLPAFLQRGFNERLKAADKELQIQRLLLQGRDAEADKLQVTHDIMRQLGVETEAELQAQIKSRQISQEKLDVLYKQAEQARENERILARMDRSVRSIPSQLREIERVYSTIEQGIANLPDDARGALKDFVGNIRRQANEIIARRIADNLFGNFFARLEDQVRGNRPIDIATAGYVDSTAKATSVLIGFTAALTNATAATNAKAANGNIAGSIAKGFGQGKSGFEDAAATIFTESRDIVVTGSKSVPMKSEIAGAIREGLNRYNKIARDAADVQSKLFKDIAKIFEGGFYGQTAGSLAFGNKNSSFGSFVGGALGEKLGEKFLSKGLEKIAGGLGKFAGPIGAIAGGLLGGALGGLLSKTPRGYATIGAGADGKLAVTGTGGNSNSAIKAGNQAAGATIDTLDKIAEMLGGSYDASKGSVSIGRSGDSWHVDTTGRGRLKKSQGGLDFDDDYDAAVRAATMDLIKDGVISGLRASTQRLLQQGKDLDAAVQKALDFESVFTRLKEYDDPTGAALDALDREFERLNKIFKDAGASAAEYADLERLYGLERAKAIEEATNRVTGSLKDLYGELTIGDNGKSLRDRLSAAQAVYDPLKARVQAGDRSAYDAYAKAAQDLLGIQREFSGSQSPYFALLNEVTNLTKSAIDRESNIISIAEGRDSPFTSTGKASDTYAPVVSAIGETNDLLRQIGRLIAGGGSTTTGGFTPRFL